MFLVEPLEGTERDAARLELLAAFLDQHSPEIVLVIVAPRNRLAGLPPSAYDEAYAAENLAAVARRIREQDPRGIIRPFPKPKG